SQEQTIPYIIIDIVRLPTRGRLTLFNVYVALSRSSGQEDERLQELNLKTEAWWKGICREEIDINVYTDR
ncbi:hypothetical protein K439DRAFT_1369212, partial [Ramaria rubella]